MTSLLCKLFGHKVIGLNTKRFFAWCDRCNKGLKCSYDMSYGETLVVGDYGNQRTFCWCDCGNELCSEGKLISDTYEYGVEYECSKCGQKSSWCFDAPIPYRIKDEVLTPTKTDKTTEELEKAVEAERERIKGLIQGWEASERINFDSDEDFQLHRQKVGAINWYTGLVHGWIEATPTKTDKQTEV